MDDVNSSSPRFQATLLLENDSSNQGYLELTPQIIQFRSNGINGYDDDASASKEQQMLSLSLPLCLLRRHQIISDVDRGAEDLLELSFKDVILRMPSREQLQQACRQLDQQSTLSNIEPRRLASTECTEGEEEGPGVGAGASTRAGLGEEEEEEEAFEGSVEGSVDENFILRVLVERRKQQQQEDSEDRLVAQTPAQRAPFSFIEDASRNTPVPTFEVAEAEQQQDATQDNASHGTDADPASREMLDSPTPHEKNRMVAVAAAAAPALAIAAPRGKEVDMDAASMAATASTRNNTEWDTLPAQHPVPLDGIVPPLPGAGAYAIGPPIIMPSNDDDSDTATEQSHDDEESQQQGNGMLVEATLVHENSDHARDELVVVAKPLDQRTTVCGVVFLLLVVAGLLIGFLAFGSNDKPEITTDMPTSAPGMSPTPLPIPPLQQVRERGTLRCGVLSAVLDMIKTISYLKELGQLPADLLEEDGASVLCRVIAVAAIGTDYDVEIVGVDLANGLEFLANDTIDILLQDPTPTLGRDVHDANTEIGFSHSVPYLHDGLRFSGDPFYVACADDDIKTFFECSDIKICVVEGVTYDPFLGQRIPGRNLVFVPNLWSVYDTFIEGGCNVMALQSISSSEFAVRLHGYGGPYAEGDKFFSQDTISMTVLDDGDSEWIDFVNSVLLSLFAAEQQGITKATASDFGESLLFDDGSGEYKDMFINAISIGGNYGELYETHFEPLNPRIWNSLNNGTSGLMYAHKLESITRVRPPPTENGSLHQILQRGILRCAIRPGRLGFARYTNGTTSALTGLDAEYCHALSASLFSGEYGFVDFVEVLDEKDGFQKLSRGEVDVFAGVTWTVQNDVSELSTGEGFFFTTPYFYRPIGYETDQRFGDNLCLATRQTDDQWSSFVRWIVLATISAESNGITQRFSSRMPLVDAFGEHLGRIFRDAIHGVGNYGEMYDRHVERFLPRSGRNLVHTVEDDGPQIYVVPGFFD